MSLRRLLRETMGVATESDTANNSPSTNPTFTTPSETIRCQRQPLSVQMQLELGISRMRPAYRLFYESSTTLANDSRVYIGGTAYDIVSSSPSTKSGWPSEAVIQEAL